MALFQMISSLNSVCTFCSLNKTYIMIKASPRGSFWFSTHRPCYCGGVVCCGFIKVHILFFDPLTQNWLVKTRRGWISFTGFDSNPLTYHYEAEFYALQWEAKWPIERAATWLLCSIHSFFLYKWPRCPASHSHQKGNSRELFIWIVYLVVSG